MKKTKSKRRKGIGREINRNKKDRMTEDEEEKGNEKEEEQEGTQIEIGKIEGPGDEQE